MPAETDYRQIPVLPSSVLMDEHIEDAFIRKFVGLKYTQRPAILDCSYNFANNNACRFAFSAEEILNNACMFAGETELSLVA